MKQKAVYQHIETWFHDFRLESRKRRESLGPLQPRQAADDAFGDADTVETSALSTHQIVWAGDVTGQMSLDVWRGTAGNSKSWRRYPKAIASKQFRRKHTLSKRIDVERRFDKALEWVPSAFVRSQHAERPSRMERIVRCRTPCPRSQKMRHVDPHQLHAGNDFVIPERKCGDVSQAPHSEVQRLGRDTAGNDTRGPASVFIRFTWKNKILTNGVGQLDRFIPTGLLFRSVWRVDEFLRNESHADVYSLTNARIDPSRDERTAVLEGHVFLDEYHGNSEVYAKRQKTRMRESGNCLDAFWYNGRHIMVMKVLKQLSPFRLRNTEEEFPSLIDRGTCMVHVALQRRCFRGKPTYAAITGSRPPAREAARLPSPKTVLEKEIEKIEKARLKKAHKQKWKRQVQRDARRFEKHMTNLHRETLEEYERALEGVMERLQTELEWIENAPIDEAQKHEYKRRAQRETKVSQMRIKELIIAGD